MIRYAFLVSLLVLTGCRDSSGAFDLHSSVADLQARALSDDTAWLLLESLTTEIGARMGGSKADARAVAWARTKMNEMGFDRVWLEHVDFPLWLRNAETARLIAPSPHPLDVTALGGSPGTGGAIRGEVIHFDNLEALETATHEIVEGKIVFISERMERSRDGSGYGKTVRQRSRGPFVAAARGALALLIRSVGTDADGVPHTGMISGSQPGTPVPSAALSNPSADLLAGFLTKTGPVMVELDLDCGFNGRGVSQNVIGEFDGSQDSGGFVVVGAHLDSWDLGTGAMDDGAGVAITMAAAKLVADQEQRPQRGIRVVLFANEEQGVYGGKAYAAAHATELAQHVLGAESDMGSGRIYRFLSRVNAASEPAIEELADLLSPLGIPRETTAIARGGADLGQMRKIGMPVIDLSHDASAYFDLHHTANDTLDQVDPQDLQFNVAAWVTLIQWAASAETVFGPVAPSE